MTLQPAGRSFIFVGLTLVVIGVLLSLAGNIPYLGRLPGDIFIKRENFSFYFPITTCIVVSVLVMLISRFFGHK